MHIYSPTYYEYINGGSRRSAEVLLPIVARQFEVHSVADFGAGQGAWLSVWNRLGVTDIAAIDGSYVDTAALLVPIEQFVPTDLSQPVQMGRRFDLVQSLEVAEHLPASAASEFIDSLVAHGSTVLFSAATPGQGGEHHVNEQPYDYWRRLFSARGYVMLDAVRPFLAGNAVVEPWYRYNTFIFVHHSRFDDLPADVRRFRIDGADPVRDVSPPIYQLRKKIIAMLPRWAVTQLAILKKHGSARFSASAQAM